MSSIFEPPQKAQKAQKLTKAFLPAKNSKGREREIPSLKLKP
jgi:hypothetical protein